MVFVLAAAVAAAGLAAGVFSLQVLGELSWLVFWSVFIVLGFSDFPDPHIDLHIDFILAIVLRYLTSVRWEAAPWYAPDGGWRSLVWCVIRCLQILYCYDLLGRGGILVASFVGGGNAKILCRALLGLFVAFDSSDSTLVTKVRDVVAPITFPTKQDNCFGENFLQGKRFCLD